MMAGMLGFYLDEVEGICSSRNPSSAECAAAIGRVGPVAVAPGVSTAPEITKPVVSITMLLVCKPVGLPGLVPCGAESNLLPAG